MSDRDKEKLKSLLVALIKEKDSDIKTTNYVLTNYPHSHEYKQEKFKDIARIELDIFYINIVLDILKELK